MTAASDAMLKTLTYKERSKMIDDFRQRYADGLATKAQCDDFLRTVRRIEDELAGIYWPEELRRNENRS